jgi:hypothetical protein
MIRESDMVDEYSHDRLGWARFSNCKKYRFRLGRKLTPRTIDLSWEEIRAGYPLVRVVFLMLNPSVADAFKPDRTVERCMDFARRWGADVLEVVNLFAFISTDPKAMERFVVSGMSPIEGIGGWTDNNLQILDACRGAHKVIAAWGNGGGLYDRDKAIMGKLADHHIVLEALALTKERHPRHPHARGVHRIPEDTLPRPLAELLEAA